MDYDETSDHMVFTAFVRGLLFSNCINTSKKLFDDGFDPIMQIQNILIKFLAALSYYLYKFCILIHQNVWNFAKMQKSF